MDYNIDKSCIKVVNSGMNFEKYDMYYVILKLDNGSEKIIRTFVDKGTISQNTMLQGLDPVEYDDFMRTLFSSCLFGKYGFINADKREDMIYMGRIENLQDYNVYIERNHIRSDGKIAKKEFEDLLCKLELQVYTRENSYKGKYEKQKKNIYAISDIHGMYGSYMEAVGKLKNNDELYVIGDVMDRGKYGFEIIKDVMQRKNVHFIMGNHEWYMIKGIGVLKKYGLENMECAQLIQIIKEENEKIKRLHTFNADVLLLKNWLIDNKCGETLKQYQNLSEDEKKKILEFLNKSAVIQQVVIDNANFCLVHANPPRYKDVINQMLDSKEKMVTYEELKNMQTTYEFESTMEYMTEVRENIDGFRLMNRMGFITVYGHTPQDNNKVFIDDELKRCCIDTGCPGGGKLAMMCLNNGNVNYIDSKEKWVEKKSTDDSDPDI